MIRASCLRLRLAALTWAGLTTLALVPNAAAQERAVYRCPGNLYTDQITPKEAVERGCRTLDGAPVTVVQGTAPRRAAPAAGEGAARVSAPAASGSTRLAGAPDMRVDPAQQRARDSDARRILESELAREESALAVLRKDYNNGEPERRGDERNFARYQERVAEMKAAIARKEADVAAIRRELSKLPNP
ncbi:MAG: hypothetical protein RL654_1466 [Pseudomonadota bacterium]|jgi:hypothetical protein